VTDGQAGAVCPRCGSAAAVRSIAEWVAMARVQTGGQQPGYGPQQPGYGPQQPGYGPGPQPGYGPGPGPQSGFPDPSQYQQSGFPDPSQYEQPPNQAGPRPSQQPEAQAEPPPSGPPGNQAEPWPGQQPGNQAEPWPGQQPGFPAGPAPRPHYRAGSWPDEGSGYRPGPPAGTPSTWAGTGYDTSLADDVAGAVMDTATRFLGRAIGRRVRRTLDERVLPAMASRQEAMLRERMAIAERHPDLRACLNDQVIFLAGGTRVLPLASATGVLTVEQADALVARLRDG